MWLSRSSSGLRAAVVACLAVSHVSAQSQRLVTLDVVALDPRGQAIRDLRSTDIRVFDNGKPYKSLCSGAETRGLTRQLSPNEYSNQRAPPIQ
jgi:hypothetical protein